MPFDFIDHYLNTASSLSGDAVARRDAVQAALKDGLPTSKHENWRYTNLKALKSNAFALTSVADQNEMVIEDGLKDVSARLVFINGHYSPEQSQFFDERAKASIRISDEYSSALAVPDKTDVITGMNAGLMQAGAVINVAENCVIDLPISIQHISEGADYGAQFIRHTITLSEGASASVIEAFTGNDKTYWTNAITNIKLCDGAQLDHVRLSEEGVNAVHTSKAFVLMDAKAKYHALTLSLGGETTRFESHVRIQGEGAVATIDGAALASLGTSHDALTHIDHTVPNAHSDQVFRTIASKRGRTSFQGKVTVAQNAQKTLADQSFRALLLDRTGEANAKPELEILADDVKCSHGATVGELDENALFYMQSRGIDPDTARQILVEAFTGDALARLSEGALKDMLVAKTQNWMRTHLTSEAI